jgi:hypothetical protein
VVAGQITLIEEEQTHQDRRLAEEIREAADDLVNRIGQQGSMA